MSGSRRDRDGAAPEGKPARAKPSDMKSGGAKLAGTKPAGAPATRRAAAPRKAAGSARKPGGKPGDKPGAGKGRGAARIARFVPALRRRWLRVALLVSAPLILLPIAHGFFGDFGAVLIGTLVLGFLVGRWTLPG